MKILLLAAAVALAIGPVLCSSPGNEGQLVPLLEEIKGIEQDMKVLLKASMSEPRDCMDLLDQGDDESGLRVVYPDPDRPQHSVEVYCNNTIDGGGWTVFQRRTDDGIRQRFERSWNDYKEGFGDMNGEFWLGLETLHKLTYGRDHEVRIDLEDYDGDHGWAKYGQFRVESEATNYRLTILRYSGNAGDDMQYNNGQGFSTPDADHDSTHINCAKLHRGGWWYNNCGNANLNGYQHVARYYKSSIWPEGIVWQEWRGPWNSLKRTTMMVRPALWSPDESPDTWPEPSDVYETVYRGYNSMLSSLTSLFTS